jgi:hypothetical protein
MSNPCPCGEDHTSRAAYYVTAIDGSRTAIVCGPYPTHAAALAEVDEARRRVVDLLPEAWFYEWGTCGSDDPLSARWVSAAFISA